ncbi:hypothetical protein GCM10028784_11740 [Myceligenerans cantabricum]
MTAAVLGPAWAGAESVTEPQAWHSPQRPTHFTVVQPHSVHAYAGLARLVVVATRGTLLRVTDTARPGRRAGPPRGPARGPARRGQAARLRVSVGHAS